MGSWLNSDPELIVCGGPYLQHAAWRSWWPAPRRSLCCCCWNLFEGLCRRRPCMKGRPPLNPEPTWWLPAPPIPSLRLVQPDCCVRWSHPPPWHQRDRRRAPAPLPLGLPPLNCFVVLLTLQTTSPLLQHTGQRFCFPSRVKHCLCGCACFLCPPPPQSFCPLLLIVLLLLEAGLWAGFKKYWGHEWVQFFFPPFLFFVPKTSQSSRYWVCNCRN